MKYNKIMAFFAIIAPIGILIRTMQVFFTLDSNGFTIEYYTKIGIGMISLVFLSVALNTFLGTLVHLRPENPPIVKYPLCVYSVILGVFTIVDSFMLVASPASPIWQYALLKIFALLSGILWIIYGLQGIIKIKIPQSAFIIAVIYWTVRLIWIFTTLNALAITPSHILILATYCAILVFMLQFAKLMNGLDTEYNFKKLLASGLCAVSLCGCYSVPYIIKVAFESKSILIESFYSTLLVFVTGIFILSFLVAHFSKHNIDRQSSSNEDKIN